MNKYSPKQRYMTDEEQTKYIKMQVANTIAMAVIRIFLAIPFSLFLYMSLQENTEFKKFIFLLMVNLFGLLLPATFTGLMDYCSRIIQIMLIKAQNFLVNIYNVTQSCMGKKQKILPPPSEEIFTDEDDLHLRIFISYIGILIALLFITLINLKDPKYQTMSISLISVLYGAAISQHLDPITKIVSFDIEIKKSL
ncbi:hypothetical protein [Rodentibacter caecimuris]|uniref:ABC transmembrane type-1 domain-containing protein n=1 Tax=Rodentibacter caecimuris TaxID=1796644 RepID=A0ABX3KYJ8_9PAST|nr:hypothetical protein BKG89_10010 [Rodentibacter heylii]